MAKVYYLHSYWKSSPSHLKNKKSVALTPDECVLNYAEVLDQSMKFGTLIPVGEVKKIQEVIFYSATVVQSYCTRDTLY